MTYSAYEVAKLELVGKDTPVNVLFPLELLKKNLFVCNSIIVIFWVWRYFLPISFSVGKGECLMVRLVIKLNLFKDANLAMLTYDVTDN